MLLLVYTFFVTFVIIVLMMIVVPKTEGSANIYAHLNAVFKMFWGLFIVDDL